MTDVMWLLWDCAWVVMAGIWVAAFVWIRRIRRRSLGNWSEPRAALGAGESVAYTIEHGQLKSAPKPFMLTPEDEFDWFCTCPACYWLGNHPVEIRAPEVRTEPYPGYVDDSYVVGSWQNPNIRRLERKAFDYGWIAQRTCYMCGHTWKTPANAPKE